MGATTDLIEAIRAAPDDDAPRLVWADAVGGERGELVVIQCDLARGGLSTSETIARKRRQRELLALHGAEWSGLRGLARSCAFQRGFVDAAHIMTSTFLDRADDIRNAAPLLSSLTASGYGEVDALGVLERLLAHPALRELRGLDLWHISRAVRHEYEFERVSELYLGNEAAARLVATGVLRGLHAVGITHSGLGSHGAYALANPLAVNEIERLSVITYEPDAIMPLLRAGAFTALRALAIDGELDGAITSVIPPSVIELAIGGVTDETLAVLAASPIAAKLERLDITQSQLSRNTNAFALFPRLRALSVRGTIGFGPGPAEREALRVLASQTLPALRELSIAVRMSEESVRGLVHSFGPQLELLDLRGNHHALRHVNDFKRKVAGEILVGEQAVSERGLLRLGPTIQVPWWDHVWFT